MHHSESFCPQVVMQIACGAVGELQDDNDCRRALADAPIERLEKARVGRLLAQAKSLREAEEIRAYVSAVRERQATLDDPLSATGFQQWADWALSQADRIDPVLSGSFRTVQDDD